MPWLKTWRHSGYYSPELQCVCILCDGTDSHFMATPLVTLSRKVSHIFSDTCWHLSDGHASSRRQMFLLAAMDLGSLNSLRLSLLKSGCFRLRVLIIVGVVCRYLWVQIAIKDLCYEHQVPVFDNYRSGETPRIQNNSTLRTKG